MDLIQKGKNYLLEDNFQIRASDNYVNIVSYDKMIHFDNKEVKIQYRNKVITVIGDKLVVSKLVSDEVLVCGMIQKIEFR